MKKVYPLLMLVYFIAIFTSCTKDNISNTTPTTAKCKPLTESINFNAGNVTYTYSYNTDGTLANISYPPNNMAVNYNAAFITYPARTTTLTNSLNTAYDANIYKGLPTKATQFLILDGITYRNYMVFTFSYDLKNRFAKIIETTPNVANDVEYQLTIIYNDQDNVSQLKYESYNGPAFLVAINAMGYEDKPSPYSGIKNWHLSMHAGWNNYDPAPILEALSKNNLLGSNITGDGVNASTVSRTMAYT